MIRLLGAAHLAVAVVFAPAGLLLGPATFPVVAVLLGWLVWLGVQLLRLRARRALRNTHIVLLPLAGLLVTYGVFALQAGARSAASGGGLISNFGLIPLAEGMLLAALSAASLCTALRGAGFEGS